MTAVKYRWNIVTRMSEDQPEVFGTYVDLKDENDRVLRSTPMIRQLPSETHERKVNVKDFLISRAGRKDLIDRGKRSRKEKLAPVFDADRYESFVEKRSGKREIFMKETGKYPYSFYLVNRVMYVGNHISKGKQFSTKSLEEQKPMLNRMSLTKEDAFEQRCIY